MPIDFRDGRTFPRRGREPLDGVLWLLRMTDKGRAAAAGTIHDYVYPCPMDRGVMERWGVSPAEFDAALAANADDAGMLAWLRGRVDGAQIEAANRWLLETKGENLDRQDREERVA